MKFKKNNGQFTIGQMSSRNAEDERDVRFIKKSLIDDGYTVDRLQLAMSNGRIYEDKFGGTRGNRNMIKAIEIRLDELKIGK